jgi:hypothetical protein
LEQQRNEENIGALTQCRKKTITYQFFSHIFKITNWLFVSRWNYVFNYVIIFIPPSV